MARMFILAGLILLLIGMVLYIAPGALKWFGRLPGDIHYQGEHGKVFIPLTSMLLISLVLNLLFYLLKK